MLSSIRSSFKNTLVYGIGNLANKVVGFIFIPFYVKYFSTEAYGVLALLEVTSTAIISIFGLALYQAYYRWYFEKEYVEKRKTLFCTVLLTLLLFLLFLYLSFFLNKTVITKLLFESEEYHSVLNLMVISSLLSIIIQLIATLMQLMQKAVLYSVASVTMLFVQMALTLYFLIFKSLGVESIYYAQIIASFVYLLITLDLIIKNIKMKFEFIILRSMIFYSFPFLLSNIGALVISFSDRYFMRVFGSFADLGSYQFACKIANTLSVLIISSAQMAIFPMLFQKINDPNIKRVFTKTVTYFIFCTMFFVLILNFFSYEFVKLIARNSDFWTSLYLIPIISLGYLFTVIKDFASVALQIEKKSFAISIVIMVISIVSLFSNYIFVHKFGGLGAALSFVAMQFIYMLFMLFFAQKYFKVPYEYLKIVMMIGVAIILFLITLLIKDTPLLIRLSLKPLLIIAYPIILYYLGFFESIEIDRIKSGWLKWSNISKIKDNIRNMIKEGTS